MKLVINSNINFHLLDFLNKNKNLIKNEKLKKKKEVKLNKMAWGEHVGGAKNWIRRGSGKVGSLGGIRGEKNTPINYEQLDI